MMENTASHSMLARSGMQGIMLALGLSLSLAGCPQPVPRVSIPGSDTSSPTLVWETYNLQTRERGEIAEDGRTVDVQSSEQYVVTLAVEDLHSGVKDVSLGGEAQYACELNGQVEKKVLQLEPQDTTHAPDHENKVPVRASLSYTVEFGKSGCKEAWAFAGGKLALVGKGHNFTDGAAMKKLNFDLKKQALR